MGGGEGLNDLGGDLAVCVAATLTGFGAQGAAAVRTTWLQLVARFRTLGAAGGAKDCSAVVLVDTIGTGSTGAAAGRGISGGTSASKDLS